MRTHAVLGCVLFVVACHQGTGGGDELPRDDAGAAPSPVAQPAQAADATADEGASPEAPSAELEER